MKTKEEIETEIRQLQSIIDSGELTKEGIKLSEQSQSTLHWVLGYHGDSCPAYVINNVHYKD